VMHYSVAYAKAHQFLNHATVQVNTFSRPCLNISLPEKLKSVRYLICECVRVMLGAEPRASFKHAVYYWAIPLDPKIR
jgi:hypothetical protein